jgi:hypothetical protein
VETKHSFIHRDERNQSKIDDDFPPLTNNQIKEIKRRKEDYDDRTRYLLASVYSSNFVLYYNISDDVYILNRPKQATLFKRRNTAQIIRRHTKNRPQILSCQVSRSGKLVLKSIEKGKPRFSK